MNQPIKPLIELLFEGQRWIDQSLLRQMAEAGWPELTRAQSLVFGQIQAGCQRSSHIANRLGVSRQAAHRTVLELVDAGYLSFELDLENRSAKKIVLTELGQEIVTDAHRIFQTIEAQLINKLGSEAVYAMRTVLEMDWGEP